MTSKKKATEGDEIFRSKASEDDVEGHRLAMKATEGDEIARTRASEDDVEGHDIGRMDPMLAREFARARERDVQREASRNSLIAEAKRAPKRKR